jgi:shikimate kinase
VTIVLVGMPGCGKSTAGRQLARQLGWSFVDTDAEIEKQIGCSIRSYFDRHGEERFREIEERVVERLARPSELVLATGGGAVLREANRRALGQPGNLVVYLRATPEDLARRLRHDTHRPLLQGGDALRRLRDLFRQRDPLYRQVAGFVLDTGRTSVPTLVNLLHMQLELAGLNAKPGDGRPGA